MQTIAKALWTGMLTGAESHDRATAKSPEVAGYSGSIAQALYWVGFEVANVVVHGARR